MNKIAKIINGKIVYGEHAEIVRPNETEARARRQSMKTEYRKDMLQKNQVGYYKAYPKEAENLNPELRRLLS